MVIENLAVGVVTFNRLELLKKVIQGLRDQSHKPHKIFVVNNSSTDGTSEWLEQQSDLTIFKQPNCGSSGGQYRTVLEMYRAGYEWLWIMDDDVCPEKDCLKNLFKQKDEKSIIAPMRFGADGKPYLNDTLVFNLNNPFKSIWTKILSENELSNSKIYAEGITFEGPLFHRRLIEEIGLPDKDFFIYADDTEFMLRAKKAGYKSLIVRESILNRLLPPVDEKKFTWKHYYVLRNIMIVDKLFGNFPVRVFRPLCYTLVWLARAKNFDNLKTVIKAYKDSIFYKQKDLKISDK